MRVIGPSGGDGGVDVLLVLMSSSTCLFLVLHDATAVDGWYYSSSLVGILDHHIRDRPHQELKIAACGLE